MKNVGFENTCEYKNSEMISAQGNFPEELISLLTPVRHQIQQIMGGKPVSVAICGGSAVGKTQFFTLGLAHFFDSVTIISEDDYCIGNSHSAKLHGTPHLHVPEDYDPLRLRSDILALKAGKSIMKPIYSYKKRERSGCVRVDPGSIVIVEGEFLLHEPLRDAFDVSLFIDTDDHSRFMRRMIRSRRNPDQTDEHRIAEYTNLSFPFYHSHIASQTENADFVIENKYTPQEGIERIPDRFYDVVLLTDDVLPIIDSDLDKTIQFTKEFFTHPHMSSQELICVTHFDDHTITIEYEPGMVMDKEGNACTPRFTFNLNEDIQVFSNIGYTPIASLKGYMRKSNDVSIYTLNTGQQIITLSCNIGGNSEAFKTKLTTLKQKLCYDAIKWESLDRFVMDKTKVL